MNYNDGTKILLALSLATNEMSKRAQMFPETFFPDVTANTNCQKRNIFLMVIKDSDGSTSIGNITVMPSGKRWVYSLICQTFFAKLYGEGTIKETDYA